MNQDFNPLASKMLFACPQRLIASSAWNEHVPFAMLLVEMQRPRMIVELGTYAGVSYCAWCQAVETLSLETQCFAVDTWAGDPHGGFYSDDIYKQLRDYHRQYESFSKLLRMTFDDALMQVADQSVDLLHIDGLHTYEAVKHDYESWLPKMSDKGIIIFHDTVVTERGFGVHQLWSELSPQFPHFNFEHGHGLGILAVGREQPETISNFLQTANKNSSSTRELFFALGNRLKCGLQCVKLNAEIERLQELQHSIDYRWGQRILAPLRKVRKILR